MPSDSYLNYLRDGVFSAGSDAMKIAREIEADKRAEFRKTFESQQGMQTLRAIERMCLHNDDSLQGNLEPNPTIMAQREGMRAVYRNLIQILGRDWISQKQKGQQ